MSNTIHIHKKHVIEYSDCGFSWNAQELNSLLTHQGCSVHLSDEFDFYSDWEIPEDNLKIAVAKTDTLSDEELETYFKEGDLSAQEIRDNLKQMLEDGDHRDGYYHFSWF